MVQILWGSQRMLPGVALGFLPSTSTQTFSEPMASDASVIAYCGPVLEAFLSSQQHTSPDLAAFLLRYHGSRELAVIRSHKKRWARPSCFLSISCCPSSQVYFGHSPRSCPFSLCGFLCYENKRRVVGKTEKVYNNIFNILT
jgi:hypothetical protein